MAASSSDRPARLQVGADEAGVSEVVGFLLTFAIISSILVVAMLGFNDAQQRAEVRLIEIQGSSAAQRVASAAVDLALFANQHNADPDLTVDASVAIDLPAELQGISYRVYVCQEHPSAPQPLGHCEDPDDFCDSFACPYVKVSSSRGDPQRQSTFLLSGEAFCTDDDYAASGGIVLVTYFPDRDCIGLIEERV